MECLGRLQLKAADLHDVERFGRRVRHLRAERRADVAPDHGLQSARGEHAASQRRRRRLSFCPSDRHNPPCQPPRCQLDLADHGHTGAARLDDRRLVRGERPDSAPADPPPQTSRCRCSPSSRSTPAPRSICFGFRLELGARVAQRDARAAFGEQQRGRDAAARRPNHSDVLSAHRETHRSFNVVRLNNAKMIATIKNRVMTFGSLQPISSKWWCKRRHLEDALAGQLERRHLDDDGQRFEHEHAADDVAAAAPA